MRPVYSPGTFSFHELRAGLLSAGELLLDDVRVVEDPDGAARQLIQNGTFGGSLLNPTGNTNRWRLLGTHRHSAPHLEPGAGAAMRLVATEPMSYLNNLVETSLKHSGSLVPVSTGTTYEVSFRAKWLAGSPQFHSELYYNKVARTTVLEQPAASGTPGAPNSTRVDNLGPTFSGLFHHPPVPPANTPVTVGARVSDPDGVSAVTLHYAVEGNGFQTVPMATGGDGTYTATIPGQPAARVVQFYLSADDAAAAPAASLHPAAGAGSRALVQWEDGRASGTRQNLRLILLARDRTALHAANDILSNDRIGCTVVSNEREVAYDAGVRLRGSMFSRNNAGQTGLNIRLPADRPFRGVHASITVRRRGMIEILAKHLVVQAGGLPGEYNDVVQLIYGTTQLGPARLSMARYGDVYLDGLGPDGADGTVFKMEGMREFQATVDGNPESPKKPFNPIGWVGSFDIADLGDDPEQYRHAYKIINNRAKDDYAPIVAMAKSFSLDGAPLEAALPEAIDIDAWLRQFALLSLLRINDTYTQGNPHNINFYVRPSDGKIVSMPWDWDFTFSRGVNSPLVGNKNFGRIINRPVFLRRFHGHLLDLMEGPVNAAYMGRWLSHYGSLTGENYSGRTNDFNGRNNYVMSQLPAAFPFSISSPDAQVAAISAAVRGNGWIDVAEIRLAASGDPLPVRWLDGNRWEVDVPLRVGANEVTLQAVDLRGRTVGTASVTLTNTGGTEPASAANIAVSEIMYHPAEPSPAEAAAGFTDQDDFEFIELVNRGEHTADLAGAAFTRGVDFTFGAGQTLAPGAYLVIVSNAAAAAARYGVDLPVAGAFANGTRLANGGERVTLTDASGAVISDFSYGDAEPWPGRADGAGASLERRAPAGAGGAGPGEAAAWTASRVPGGTPGSAPPPDLEGWVRAVFNPAERADPAVSGDAADPDGDGLSNLLEYAFGGDPKRGGRDLLPGLERGSGAGDRTLRFAFRRARGAGDLVYTVETSTDLDQWLGDTEIDEGDPADNGDGTETVTVTADPGPRAFYFRLRVRRTAPSP